MSGIVRFIDAALGGRFAGVRLAKEHIREPVAVALFTEVNGPKERGRVGRWGCYNDAAAVDMLRFIRELSGEKRK